MTKRKTGAKKSFSELMKETSPQMLKRVKQFIRADFGGKEPKTVIKNKMAKRGVQCGDVSAEIIYDIITEVVEGCRKRSFERIDIVIARLENRAPTETLP